MLASSKIVSTLLASLLVAASGSAFAEEVDFKKLKPGSFPLVINKTGANLDEKVYVQLISSPNAAQTKSGQPEVWYINVKPNTKVTGAPNNHNGSLAEFVKGTPGSAENPIPSFELSQLENGTLILPGDGEYHGARLWVSIGKPMTMWVNGDANGYVQPDLHNAADPNSKIPFDFVEFTYKYANGRAEIPFGVNLTQVDGFAVPLALTLHGVSNSKAERGISLNSKGKIGSSGVASRAELIDIYLNTVSEPFRTLTRKDGDKVISLRAPYFGHNFKAGKDAGYFAPYVDKVWASYTNPTTVSDQPDFNAGNKYQITSSGEKLSVTRIPVDGSSPKTFLIAKPSTEEIFKCNGPLFDVTPTAVEERAFGAMMCGSLNRSVAEAEKAELWLKPDTYYQGTPKNEWSDFWHKVSIDKLAYGFGYDDTAGQSSVTILPGHDNVSHVELEIGL
jgi:hypothetical protein